MSGYLLFDVVVFKAPYRPFKQRTSLEEHHILELAKKLPFTLSSKIPEISKKSPLSKVGKHPDFQVTPCLHFVTTNVDFAYIESE